VNQYFLAILSGSRGGFTEGCDGDVLCIGIFEDFLGAIHFIAVLGMDRDEVISFSDAVFIALRFQLWNAQADEAASDAANGCSSSGTTEGGEKRTGCNEWTHARDGECAEADEEAEGSAENAACTDSRYRAFRCLGILFVSELVGGILVRIEDGDVVVGEAGVDKAIDDLQGLAFGNGDGVYGFMTHGSSVLV